MTKISKAKITKKKRFLTLFQCVRVSVFQFNTIMDFSQFLFLIKNLLFFSWSEKNEKKNVEDKSNLRFIWEIFFIFILDG